MDPIGISEKSNHIVETFILKELIKHPQADRLSIVQVEGTDYTCIVKTEEWEDKINRLVAWIPPDSIVNTERPEFSFLQQNKRGPRVRAIKLRGVNSYGILVLAPEGLKPGDDAAEALQVCHYDPENDSKNKKEFTTFSGEAAPAPKGIVYPVYSVAAFLKYGKRLFKEGELVYVTEKIHGSSTRFVFRDGEMFCGSRDEWKKKWTSPPRVTLDQLINRMGDKDQAEEVYQRVVVNFKPKKSVYWEILEKNPGIKDFCQSHPNWCLYGEAFGNNKRFMYGNQGESLLFRAFDILVPEIPTSRWLDTDKLMEICDQFQIPPVPLLAKIPFDFEILVAMAEGNSTIPGANHIREGVVVKPEKDRLDSAFRRVCLKIVSPQYLAIN